MPQIFLFTGENEYELSKERSRWTTEFAQKHGPENMLVVNATSLTHGTLMDEVSVAPFIAEKRMLVVMGIPKLEKDQILSLESVMHPQVLLLFIEPKPDKRLAATKALLSIATVKTFSRIRGSSLMAWLCDYAKGLGSSLSQDDARILLTMVGEDQMLLANEVTKLATYADDRPITRHDIEHLVVLSTEQAVWQLLDLLAARKRDEALSFAHALLKRGENPHGLWNMFLWIVSQISLVVSQVTEGNANPATIAKECGMHPNSVRNILSLARTYDQEKLLSLVTLITETDKELKTGGFKATAESPEELNAIIDTRIAAVV